MSSKPEQKKKRNSNFLYDFVKITGALPTLIMLRPKTVYMGSGKKPKIKGGLICANHVSFMDPILVHCSFWNRRLHFLATTDLLRNSTLEFFFTRMHCIPVNQQNFSMDSMHAVSDVLKSGKLVVIFPEGHVNLENGEEVVAFKSGALLMAYLADTEIIPMYLVPRKKWYRRRVALMGEPFRIRDICKTPSIQSIDAAGEMLRERVLELKAQYEERKKQIKDSKETINDQGTK